MENLDKTNDQMQELLQTFYTMCVTHGPKVILALVTLVVGLWLIKKFTNSLNKNLTSKGDATLGGFVSSVLSMIFKGVLLLSVAGMVGIETTSFIAVLGAAGLAVGLALKDSLQNFAAGIMMIIFRPFKLGDFIEAGGVNGVVEKISVFSTIMKTGDNREIIIPNGQIYAGAITNYSARDTRRIDLVFGIGYDDDMLKAKQIMEDVLTAHELILEEPAPAVAVVELADSSVNFNVRPWVKSGDYWAVRADVLQQIKLAFDNNEISTPYPQMDIHSK